VPLMVCHDMVWNWVCGALHQCILAFGTCPFQKYPEILARRRPRKHQDFRMLLRLAKYFGDGWCTSMAVKLVKRKNGDSGDGPIN